MRTFVTTAKTSFMFTDDSDDTAIVMTGDVPTLGDLREFLTFVDEDRRGPQVVRKPLFLVNGTFFQMEYDVTLPKGTIVYVAPDGSRTRLLGTDADVDTHGIAFG